MESNSQTRMLDLLDHAYRVSDDLDAFDELLLNAHTYFFESRDGVTLVGDLPKFSDADPHLDRHIARIESLISERNSQDKLGLSLERHAQFTLSAAGRVMTTNVQAETLLPGISGQYIENLPVSLDSAEALRGLVQELRAGVESLDRIIHLQIEVGAPTPSFGFCSAVKLDNGEPGLRVSLSYFSWTEAIFKNLQSALSLSDSEALVLRGVLKGQSQKDIAEQRNRSVDTIKAQSKSILRKAGCAKMTDLSHLCTSIAYVIGLSDRTIPDTGAAEHWITPQNKMQKITLGDGRTLAWYEYGDPEGRPVLFCHGFFQGPFFLDSMKRRLLAEKLRIIAPSRPYYGHTSPPKRSRHHEITAKQDALSLISHLDLGKHILIAAAHGGSNHAFRLAAALGDQVAGMVLIDARIPMTAAQLAHMPPRTRTVSAGCRHAPGVMKMIVTLGIKTYKERGIKAFLETEYAPSDVDVADIKHADRFLKISEGMFHHAEQGANAFVYDGRAQMSDWSAEFNAVNARQHWIHGRHCHVTGAHLIEDFVRSQTNAPIDIIEDAGFNLLYQKPDLIVDILAAAAKW